jgi:3-oxoacyl-[acyl-carrier protein] reductase
MGRKVFVTGGSRGIGRAVCLELAKNGDEIAFSYCNNEDKAIEVKNIIAKAGGEALMVHIDFADLSSIEGAVTQIEKSFKGLDVLVNCAGIMPENDVDDISREEWENVVNINLTGPFFIIQRCLHMLKKSQHGRIINICSQAAYTGSARHVHYSASKAGILGLTYGLAKELGEYGILVNAISPGRIETDIIAYGTKEKRQTWLQSTPVGRLGEPKEVAAVVAFLASEKSSYMTGANINVNGGLLMG